MIDDAIRVLNSAVVTDIMSNAAHAMDAPDFASGRFASACRAYGDELRAVVERISMEEVKRRFTDNPGATLALISYSDATCRMVLMGMIAEVVKRLVVSSETT